MKTIVGLYDDLSNAHDTVNDLVAAGFDRSDISLVAGNPNNVYSTDVAATPVTDEVTDNAVAGALTGGALGGLAGMLVGLGSLAIPGLGPVIAAGPIVAGLTGAGIGAAAGGLLGALVGWGIPEEHAAYYAEGIRRGSTLVAVKAVEDRVEDAVDIMDRHDPVNIERRSAYWRSSGWTGYDPQAGSYTMDEAAAEREKYDVYADDDYHAYAPTFRRHYETSYANTTGRDFGWYEPAYRYGYGLALNDRYRDYNEWGEIEPEARGGWTLTEQGEGGTWEEFKESVRYAWEQVKNAFSDDDEYDGYDRELDITERDFATDEYPYQRATSWGSARVQNYDMGGSGGTYDNYDQRFRQHYDTTFAGSRYSYHEYQPAYRYGYDLANYAPYSGRTWHEIEPEVKTRWEEKNQGTWDQVKDAIRQGWQEVRDAVS